MVLTNCPFKRYTQKIGLLRSSIRGHNGSGSHNREKNSAQINNIYNEFAEYIKQSGWLEFLDYYVTCQDPHLMEKTWNMQIFQTVYNKLPQEIQNLYTIHYKRDEGDEKTLKYFVLTALKHRIYILKQTGEWNENDDKNRIITVKRVKKYAGNLTSTEGQDFNTIWNLP